MLFLQFQDCKDQFGSSVVNLLRDFANGRSLEADAAGRNVEPLFQSLLFRFGGKGESFFFVLSAGLVSSLQCATVGVWAFVALFGASNLAGEVLGASLKVLVVL